MPFDSTTTFDSTTINDPIIQKLEDGKQVILDRGWCQFIRHDDCSRVCLLGAYAGWGTIENTKPTTRAALEALINEIPGCYQVGDHPWSRIAVWNNKYGRTKEQVLDLIDKAIETQRAKAFVIA